MVRRFVRVLLVSLIGTSLLGVALYASLYRPIQHPEVVVTIAPGTSVAGIARALAAVSVIRSPLLFRLFVRLQGTEHSLKAGEYVFADGMTTVEVYHKLARGEFRVFRITLPEGWTLRQMADYLGQQPFAPPGFVTEFLATCRDPEVIAGFDMSDVPTLEGYLFPETYAIARPRSARDIVNVLVAEFKKRLTPEMRQRAAELGMTIPHVVTLASIIERETGTTEERPLVSSVFHNRLKQGMPLASDPTVIYGLSNYNGNIHKADLSNPHPYNTYVHVGLPPGPIANPGAASLDAALHPATTDYLFFVARNDGTHAFAVTYAEHLRNVARYQLSPR